VFQSLFLWKYLSDPSSSLRAFSPSSFNPCFYGSIFLTRLRTTTLYTWFAGFNPCFYGSIFLTRQNNAYHVNLPMFQSLFLWKYLSDPNTSDITSSTSVFQSLFLWKYLSDSAIFGVRIYQVLVSILVFMEVSFWRFRRGSHPLPPRCFNPCFYGSIFLTHQNWHGYAVFTKFQSLFLWKYLSDCLCGEVATSIIRFQSLFLWKYLSDGSVRAIPCRPCPVSILVFMEVSFWPVKLDNIIPMPQSFNPCFYGSIFLTQKNRFPSLSRPRFQSLFLWKYLSDWSRTQKKRKEARFQSLFLWKYLSDWLFWQRCWWL